MELIIIGTLTTIALLAMQAVEFLKGRSLYSPRWVPAARSSAAPVQSRTVHVDEDSLEQAA